MPLSEEEKRKRNREAAKRYRERLKKQNPEQAKKTAYRRRFGSAKSFILNYAKDPELEELREMIAERRKKMREKS